MAVAAGTTLPPMPIRDSYSRGTPCWVDLATTDPAAARSFYGELLGWSAEVDERPEAGGYAQFRKGGHPVAGCGPLFVEGMPPVWTTYIASADVDATTASVPEHGGAVMMPPFDVLDAGRMAVFTGPDGAVAGIWQARNHIGAQLVNEPGSWTWNQLATRDKVAALAFYGAVFGWELADDPEWGEHLSLDGRPIASVVEMGEAFPAEVPPHWQVAFRVDDADATVARAEELGGTAHGPMRAMPMNGRAGAVADPQGAQFGVLSIPVP